MLGESKPHFFTPDISQMFPNSNPKNMITFVLCPVEKYSNVIYGKIFKGFLLFSLSCSHGLHSKEYCLSPTQKVTLTEACEEDRPTNDGKI
jgi:hypothetical protein